MTSVSSSSSSSSLYAAYLAAKNANVPKTTNSNLVNTAAQLSENAGLMTSLFGASSDSTSSSAVDMLGSLLQPYSSLTNPFSSSGGNAAEEQASLDQQILGGSPNSSSSGLYNSSGGVNGTGATAATDWSTLMQQNPGLASAVSNSALNQSIMSQFSSYA